MLIAKFQVVAYSNEKPLSFSLHEIAETIFKYSVSSAIFWRNSFIESAIDFLEINAMMSDNLAVPRGTKL